jgi:hypothetical protein
VVTLVVLGWLGNLKVDRRKLKVLEDAVGRSHDVLVLAAAAVEVKRVAAYRALLEFHVLLMTSLDVSNGLNPASIAHLADSVVGNIGHLKVFVDDLHMKGRHLADATTEDIVVDY